MTYARFVSFVRFWRACCQNDETGIAMSLSNYRPFLFQGVVRSKKKRRSLSFCSAAIRILICDSVNIHGGQEGRLFQYLACSRLALLVPGPGLRGLNVKSKPRSIAHQTGIGSHSSTQYRAETVQIIVWLVLLLNCAGCPGIIFEKRNMLTSS